MGSRRESELVPEGDSQTLRALLQIRELLIQGAFGPGERIREVPLAARLKVSRTPLRLALDRLAHEGLLEARPAGGFVARQFTVSDIFDAIDLRGLLEGAAGLRAAERLQSESDVAPLEECVEAGEALLRRKIPGVTLVREYTRINTRFHAALMALAKSPLLTQSMERVLALPFASPNAIVLSEAESENRRDIFLISNAQHAAIADAIKHREGARAEAVTREHSRIVRRSVAAALEERRLASIPGGRLIKFPQSAS